MKTTFKYLSHQKKKMMKELQKQQEATINSENNMSPDTKLQTTTNKIHKHINRPITGIGINKEDKSKIFQILGKLDATANINTSGVGLGLSTCKKIAEALNGEIFLLEDDEDSS
jgi:signal transduction histidine kinase